MVANASVNAQQPVPKKPLIEHFTQASCGPCASQNPTMHSTLTTFGAANYVKVTYQTSWPGVDPMNAAYPTGPSARVNYYGVNGVPDVSMNGAATGWPTTIVTAATLATAAALTTDVGISVSHSHATTRNFNVNITVRNHGANALAAGKILHTALTEKEVIYSNAPGTNGETAFHHVVRNMYNANTGAASTDGYTLPAIPAGDSIVINATLTAPTYVADFNDIGFAVFVQDNANKEVLQSEYSDPVTIPTQADVSTANAMYGGANYCSNVNWTPSFEVTNTSSVTITSVEAQYSVNGGTAIPVTLSGISLAQGQSSTVSFSPTTLPVGSNDVVYDIVSLNSTDPDIFGSNNTGLTGQIHVLSSTSTGSQLVQDFTNAPLPSGTWQYSQSLPGAIFENPQNLAAGRFGVFGENSSNVDVSNCIRAAYGSGEWDNRTAAVIFDQISLTSHNTLSFDYAHALLATTGDSGLEILVSTDCGDNWTSLWNRQGAALSTAPANNSSFFYPTPNSSDWVTATVDMTSYMNQTIAIKFEFSKGTSANNLYVDNINTSLVSSITDIAAVASLAIMPNPVQDRMNVELTVVNATDLNVSIVNALGQQVKDVATQTFQ